VGDSTLRRTSASCSSRLGPDDTAQAVLRAASAAGTRLDDELLSDTRHRRPGLVGALRQRSTGLLVRRDGASEDPRTGSGTPSSGMPCTASCSRGATRLHAAYAAPLERRAGRDRQRCRCQLAHHWDAAGRPARCLPAHLGRAETRMFAFAGARPPRAVLELWQQVEDAERWPARRDRVLDRASDAAAYEGDYAAAVAGSRGARKRRQAEPRQGAPCARSGAGCCGRRATPGRGSRRCRGPRPSPNRRPASARALAHAAGLEMMAGRPRRTLTGAHERSRRATAPRRCRGGVGLGVQGGRCHARRCGAGVISFRGDAHRRATRLGHGLALSYTNLVSLLDRVVARGRSRSRARGYAAVASADWPDVRQLPARARARSLPPGTRTGREPVPRALR
jgi:hypothetical protein